MNLFKGFGAYGFLSGAGKTDFIFRGVSSTFLGGLNDVSGEILGYTCNVSSAHA